MIVTRAEPQAQKLGNCRGDYSGKELLATGDLLFREKINQFG